MLIQDLRSCLFIALYAIVGIGFAAAQPTFRVISYLNQLQVPVGLTEASPEIFYSIGGAATEAAFSITPQGSITILATFPNQYTALSQLVEGSNGRFYTSIEYLNDPASVVSLGSTPGTRKIFPPQSLGPSFAQNLPDGSLFAVSSWFGPWYLDKIDLNDNVTTIYQFPSGEAPSSSAFYGSDGNYYGLSMLSSGSGYVYRVTPSGSRTNLYTFSGNVFGTSYPTPILQASDGNLYGTTTKGGAYGAGTIYKVSLAGQYTLLYTFPKSTSSFAPTALIEASDGNLYGATIGGNSQLFRITKSGVYTLLRTMNLYTDGECQCELIQGSDGNIYGTAQMGGTYGGGDIFVLEAGLPKPAPRAQHFSPQSGAVGAKVRIWGQNLLSASVEFNGVPAASVSNAGPNYVWATVPSGASTGPITVTTPGGTVTTIASFTVE